MHIANSAEVIALLTPLPQTLLLHSSNDAYVRSNSASTAAGTASRSSRPTEPAATASDARSEHGGASGNNSSTVSQQQQQQQQRSSGKEQGLAAEWGFTDNKVGAIKRLL
jgi:anti-sigma28 factor (negative regulator of flagellin synthesis)